MPAYMITPEIELTPYGTADMRTRTSFKKGNQFGAHHNHGRARVMGRKIILLSDGTGNSSAKIWRTNVWRTFEALDLTGSEQVAYAGMCCCPRTARE
jgi:hypothetical protein